MHGSLDRTDRNQHRVPRNWSIGFFALPVALLITLVGLAMFQPSASTWISEAVQAEFTGTNPVREPAPTQFARPAGDVRTVRVN
jgi:hypothetical protein